MKTVEFCYWLMGLFELGEPSYLTKKQVVIINRHLELTFITNPDGGPFVHWLQGALEGADEVDGRRTEIIKGRLNDVFLHVIDQTYTDDPVVQEKMQDAHDGAKVKDKRRRRPRPPSGRGHGGIERRMLC